MHQGHINAAKHAQLLRREPILADGTEMDEAQAAQVDEEDLVGAILSLDRRGIVR